MWGVFWDTRAHNLRLSLPPHISSYALLWDAVNFSPPTAVIDGNEIIYRDYIDISVAVATPKVQRAIQRYIWPTIYLYVQGLVVPVLRDATHMNYAEIEKGINELGVKVRTYGLLASWIGNGRQSCMLPCRPLPTAMVVFRLVKVP